MERNLKQRLEHAIVFYDVDTQNDFMLPDGALHVPEAEKIIGGIGKLTNYARQKGHIVMGSVDRHFKDDAELKRNNGPFPDHCMNDSYGQRKIPETNPVCPAYIENKVMDGKTLDEIVGDKREIFFEKQHYDVFTNPNAELLLSQAHYAVVYGVATDYCVKAAVLGMRKLGLYVFVVTDAVKGVTKEGHDAALEEMKDKEGVRLVTTRQVLEGIAEKKIRADDGIFQ